MTYDAVVTTVEGNHTYQNIEALDEWHLADMIQEDLKTEIINIKIKETFGEGEKLGEDGTKMSKRLIEIELDEIVEDEIIVVVKKYGIIKSEIRVNGQGELIGKELEND